MTSVEFIEENNTLMVATSSAASSIISSSSSHTIMTTISVERRASHDSDQSHIDDDDAKTVVASPSNEPSSPTHVAPSYKSSTTTPTTESPKKSTFDAFLPSVVAPLPSPKPVYSPDMKLPTRAQSWPLKAVQPTRIVAVGDLHGDLEAAKEVFKMAGLVDVRGNWCGGKDMLVQLGDIADRGPDTLDLFRYMHQLGKQAAAAGGKVQMIMGNHELMKLLRKQSRISLPFLRDPFSEHGEIGRWLKKLPIMMVIDGTVFAHGGVSPYWAQLGCERTNQQAQKSMKSYIRSGDLTAAKIQFPVFGDNGPAWYRRYAYDKDEEAVSRLLDKALTSLGAKRMVVAHSPTRSPKMLVRCGGKFIDIDTKISRFFKWPDGTPDGGHLSALEIIGDRVTAIYPHGRELISDGNEVSAEPKPLSAGILRTASPVPL